MGRPAGQSGTSRCPRQNHFLVPPSLCPGTKKNSFLAVPLSRDKSKIKNPETNSSVLGRPGTKKSQNVSKISQKISKKKFLFKNCNFLLFLPLCPVVVPGYSGTGQAVNIPSRGKISKPCPVPCPGPDFDWLSRPAPSRGKILSLFRCPFVPGQQWIFCPFVPKRCTLPSHWKP
jgi:hypothetical protein